MTKTNIKKVSALVGMLLFVFFTIVPVITHSAPSADTKANHTGIVYECGDGKTAGNCEFSDLLAAIKKVTDFGTVITLGLSVVVIAIAGGKLMISGDNAGERKKVKDMLQKVAIGIGFILAAWLIVTLITGALLNPDIIKFGL